MTKTKQKPKPGLMSADSTSSPVGELRLLPLDVLIEPDTPMRATMNDEKLAELKESMNDLGLLDPLKVTPKDGGFEVIDGHRRLLVARELKWAGLPCLVLRNRDEVLEAIKIDCNMVREDVNAAEQAVYYQQLLDKYHLDEDSLCKLVHKGADYIADRLRLLRGDGRVFDALAANRISFAVARELNKCTDENMRRYYLDSAIRSGCASRVVTEWIANWRATAGLSSGPVTQIDTTPATNPIEVYHDCCALCGGDRDPLNLVTVRMHKWEWEQLSKAWEISAKGEQ